MELAVDRSRLVRIDVCEREVDRFTCAGLDQPGCVAGVLYCFASSSGEKDSRVRGRAVMASPGQLIVLENVSKFYGEVLGVNRVNLAIEHGITSLVGPNGAGKTTLLNVMTGLLKPTKGTIRVLGTDPSDPETFYRQIGYCSQFDSFPKGVTGYQLIS